MGWDTWGTIVYSVQGKDYWLDIWGTIVYSVQGQGYWLGHVGHDIVVRTGTGILVTTFGARYCSPYRDTAIGWDMWGTIA